MVGGSAQDSCSQASNLLSARAEILNIFNNYREWALGKLSEQRKVKQNSTKFSNALGIPKDG